MKTTIVRSLGRRIALHAACGVATLTVACAHTPPPAPPPVAAAAADNSFRKEIPVADEVPALHAPVPEYKLLGNGVTVLTVERPALPLISAQVIIRSGSAQDPPGLPGLAGFTSDMLRMGTTRRSAANIAEEVESRGTSIDVRVDEDAIIIGVTALKENFDAVFEVLTDVVLHPRFESKEIERVRKQRVGMVKQLEDVPPYVANSIFRQRLFGKHAYGHTPQGTLASAQKTKYKDLFAFYTHNFQPGNVAVVIVGDIPRAAAQSTIEKHFAVWKGPAKSQAPAPAPTAGEAGMVLIDRPGAPQSMLVVGQVGGARGDPDYYAMGVTNSILGGAFNSRINLNLREEHGYTYGAHSYFDFMRAPGPFFIQTSVRTDVTASALKEVFREIGGMRDKDVTDEELADAKNRYALSLPGLFQTVNAVADTVGGLYIYGLPWDDFQHIPDKVRGITQADVRRVAQKYYDPAQLIVVVHGARAQVESQLQSLERGKVQLADPAGNALP